MKLENPYPIGIIAGVSGVIVINIAEYFMRMLHISETTLWQAGGLVFLSQKAVETPLGIAIGVASHLLVGIFLGIIIAQYASLTGTDYVTYKGLAISLGALFIALGVFFPLRKIAVSMQDNPKDVISAFVDHIIFGIVASYIIKVLYSKALSKNPDTGIIHSHLVPAHAKKTFEPKKIQRFKRAVKIKKLKHW